ncbi:MAG: lamin tail domain-containing protein, partial [Myxococcales bacterium]|nr:lamin tail domain-containing protein [Myxococcales bacterium]
MSRHSLHYAFKLFVLLLCILSGGSTARAVCLSPPGDLDANLSANVGDVQCSILMNLWSLEGQINPVPTCVKVPGSPSIVADHNCDGVLNIADTLLAINFALKVALEPTLDANTNQCVDACETDSDSDGTFDLLDCAPLNPNISGAAAELCNGYDDDCDGVVDEFSTPTTHASCSDNSVCSGTELCDGLAAGLPLMITEIMADPLAVSDANGEWFEIYNGTGTSININGWTIQTGQGQTHVIDAGGALFVPPASNIVLGRQKDSTLNGGVRVNYQYSGITLDNASDSVILKNSGGAEMDRVDFGGVTGIAVVAGATAALISPELNNNVGASWATSTAVFGAGDKGTPVSPNFDVMPSFCLPGTPLVCVDGNVCTDDSCDAIAGCQFTNNIEPCDDEDPCTINDTCGGGDCAGSAVVCDDSNPCTNDSCVGGVCQFVNNTLPCDDGDVCTLIDTCAGGSCAGANPPNCDDTNPCTLDFCDQSNPGALPNGCVNDGAPLDGTSCDDGDACTDVDVCDGGGCLAGGPLFCDDGNDCTADSCDSGTGCVFDGAPLSGSPCDDGDLCTLSDICDGSGGCDPGTPVDCDDGNNCTDEQCNSGLCEYTDNTESCDDSDPCTENDVCGNGSCAGTPIDCDDGDVCTNDQCVAGLCEYTNNTEPCDDGDACTENDICDSGNCAGTQLDCDDSNECTDDQCVAGLCENIDNVAACDDGDPCTENDVCGNGSCAGTPIDCDDGDVCTNDQCVGGLCEYTNNTEPCDDGDACTEND